jgi:capsular polysaccharide biosynthesis protein
VVLLERLDRVRTRVDERARRSVRRISGGVIAAGAPRPRLFRLRIRLLSVLARDAWRWKRVIAMRDLDGAEHVTILPPSPGVSFAARRILDDPPPPDEPHVRTTFPEVRAHLVRDAWLDPRATSVSVGSSHVLSDWAFDQLASGRIKGAGVLVHDGDRVLHRLPRDPQVIEQGIQLTGNHTQNWYHWMAEILPKASLLDRLEHPARDWPLLVPEAAVRYPSYRDALHTLVPDHPIVLVPDVPVLVRRLLVLDGLILHTPGFAPSVLPRHGTELLNVDGMRRFRARLLEGLAVEPRVEPGVRLFLDRHHDPERAYNREELLGIAKEQGFVPVVGSDLSLQEQAALFSRAELVVGPNGAAWTNVLFSGEGCRGLCWLVPDGLGGPWFRNLAHVAGAELRYLEAEPRSTGNPLKVDYWVDPERFRRALVRLIEGW